MAVTRAEVVPAVKTYLGRPDEFVKAEVDAVHVWVYRHVVRAGGQVVDSKIVIDVDAPAGQRLAVTLNDGDLFRGEVSD